MIERELARVFDRVAEAYDAARPHYPDEVFHALPEITGVALAGATVADVGAGTGILTRALRAHGARVVAIDPGAEMLAFLVSRTAGTGTAGTSASGTGTYGTGAVLGDGNALPLADGSVDLVTYAQSWHWLDPVVSITEARRVLRPGGAMAACWNLADAGQAEWLAAYEARLSAEAPRYWGPAHREWRVPPIAAAFEVLEERWIPWTRLVGLEDFLLDLRSHSYMAALPAGRADDLVARRRAELLEVFPDGMLSVPMRVYLAVGR
ncbi:methyltransferase domain-containing protein [Nonomuraea sp. NBC_01738]|uniref:class I SAM-dependent methyltransferase n=1 Tax=Nonomuraea sp. NBC_01738 TaxID=2976003 RepID=UPI002E0F06E5|nr:methyltransferase domain-containing protein [Nonomuraea sp. NBC_01738]